MEKMKTLELLLDDGDTVYFTDGEHNYGLNYWFIPKEDLRDYADQDLVSYTSEPSPDGDGCVDYYYDDDSWDVDGTIVMNYIEDCVKNGMNIVENDYEAGDGEIFMIVEGDNGYHESLMERLKEKQND